ncbi:MAG TPA: hypothetical protein VID29_00315 [Solirubrobacteraceae bacterium]|jgi:hypothetical protein
MQPPGEPRDAWAYRLAICGVGLALVAFLIGGAIIGASGHAKEMVKEYWTIGAALSGALVGILAPSPRQMRTGKVEALAAQAKDRAALEAAEALAAAAPGAGGPPAIARERAAAATAAATADPLSHLGAALLSIFDVLLMFGIVVACILLAPEVNATDAALLRTIAAAAAGAILGLLAPSPIKTGPGQPG